MMNMDSPRETYQAQIQQLTAQRQIALKKRSRLGWARFFAFVLTGMLSFKIFASFGMVGLLPLFVGAAVLFYFIALDASNNKNIARLQTLISINEQELLVLDHQFTHLYEGNEFKQKEHPYTNDLDIFGRSSIYQWCNRCYTEGGRTLLAHDLSAPVMPEKVLARQEAIKEITPMLEWRQQLQAFAMHTTVSKATEKKIAEWLAQDEEKFTGGYWRPFVLIYSLLTLSAAVLTILGFIAPGIFSALYLLMLLTATVLSSRTGHAYQHLSGIVKEVTVLSSMLEWMEQPTFTSALLKNLVGASQTEGQKASAQVKQLKQILDRFDLRASIPGVLFFNSFLLWDVRQMIALNKWRKQNKHQLAAWMQLIAEAEVLHSLATIRFNQPQWSFPVFASEHFTLHTKNCGHPLLKENSRVNNDFDVQGTAKIELITGSNMAGKSTFLRSLGVNCVLAQTGSVVCASYFQLSPVLIMSSMRIADNLAENTSTFYAELKKLKSIIEAVNEQQKIFILLDEILRGTNSFDRHTGSEALMKQLIQRQSVAVIATHDVELASLQGQYPQSISNYHFDVQVEGEELYFDYKLKPGVCSSLNASILMKKIGIELNS